MWFIQDHREAQPECKLVHLGNSGDVRGDELHLRVLPYREWLAGMVNQIELPVNAVRCQKICKNE